MDINSALEALKRAYDLGNKSTTWARTSTYYKEGLLVGINTLQLIKDNNSFSTNKYSLIKLMIEKGFSASEIKSILETNK